MLNHKLWLCHMSIGTWKFDGEGEQGMIDWGAVVVNESAVAAGYKGLNALATAAAFVPGTCHAPYSMARTLGDPSGQSVATKGRKVMVSWVGNGTCEWLPITLVLSQLEFVYVRSRSLNKPCVARPVAAQSLPRELALSPSGRLLQRWVPELQTMRAWAPEQYGLQLEVWARFIVSRDSTTKALGGTPRFGFSVLGVPGTDEATYVGIDLDVGHVYIDGRKSNSCDAIPWQCADRQLQRPSPRAGGLYPAGPLLGSTHDIVIHCYVDAVFVSYIFNNETAITTMVAPSSDKAIAPVQSFGEGGGVRMNSLNTWRLALPGTKK